MSEEKSKRKIQDDENEILKSKKRANAENDVDESESDEELDEEELTDFDEDSDEEEEDEGEDGEDFDEIQVNFVAYNPDESDYHGIKRLLHQLWLKENIDLNELSNLMIEEDTIASILKEDEDEDEEKSENKNAAENDKSAENNDEEDKEEVYGIVSLIPFSSHFSAKNCIQQIKSLLLTRIPKENLIHKKLQDPKAACALVINERFVNIPWRISLPCYEQLFKDLKEYETKEEKDKYVFESVIMICKVLKPKKANVSNEYIYSNPEEEIFDQSAEGSFEYSVSDQCDSDVAAWDDEESLFEPFRKVLFFSKEKWTSTVNSLKNVT